MACQPGINYESAFTGAKIDEAIQASLNMRDITLPTHNGRITQNETDIADNKNDINQNKADILLNKSNITNHENRITANEGNITTLNTRVSANETLLASHDGAIGSLPTTYASIAGNSGQAFAVASGTPNTEHAVNYGFTEGRYALKNGSAAETFLVAIPSGPNDAVNLDYLSTNYVPVTLKATNTVFGLARRADASEGDAGITDEPFMSPLRVKELINKFAGINSLTPLP